jgi:hypothetical protein
LGAALAAEVKRKCVRDDHLTTRLLRHLQAGEVGIKGRKLQARIVRLEFWGWDDKLRRTKKHTKLTLRVWGWTAREVYSIVENALEHVRRERLGGIRKRHKDNKRIQEPEQ